MLRFIRLSAMAFASLVVGASASSAQVVVFGQWTSVDSPSTINYVDNGTSATMSGTFGVTWGAFPSYRNAAIATAPSYPGVGDVAATVNFSITTTTSGSLTGAGPFTVNQPFTSSTGTMTVTANSPINGLTNLLSMTFTGTFTGVQSDSQGSLAGSTNLGNTVIYTSQFVNFDNSQRRSYNSDINAINPGLALTGSFMDSWISTFSQFSFSAAVTTIPEPSTWAMIGLVGAGTAFMARRRKLKELAKAAAEAKAAGQAEATVVVA